MGMRTWYHFFSIYRTRRPVTTHLMSCLLLAIQPDHLNNAHLQQLVHTRNLIEDLQDVLDCLGHCALREKDECIALARGVALRGKEGVDELRRVGDEVLVFAVDRVYREYGVLPDICVAVLQTGAHDRDQRLK